MDMSLVQLKATLPLLGVGVITLILSFCFCCYLWRLKRQGQEEMGYREICFKKKRRSQSDVCPVCLDDFKQGDKLAVCRCTHSFHMKCLLQWLNQSHTCPLCKSPIGPSINESSRLMASTSNQAPLGESV